MSKLFTAQIDQLLASGARTVAGQSSETPSQTARAYGVWVHITAISGGASLEFIIETSLDGNGVDFVEQKRISGVTAISVNTSVINRADHALGAFMRVRWTISAGSATFRIRAARME